MSTSAAGGTPGEADEEISAAPDIVPPALSVPPMPGGGQAVSFTVTWLWGDGQKADRTSFDLPSQAAKTSSRVICAFYSKNGAILRAEIQPLSLDGVFSIGMKPPVYSSCFF